MCLCFFNILLGFFSVVFCLLGILVDNLQILPLLVHFRVDLSGNLINVLHCLLDMLQIFISLIDDICHVVSLSLNFDLLHV